jgi:hypothetical protein
MNINNVKNIVHTCLLIKLSNPTIIKLLTQNTLGAIDYQKKIKLPAIVEIN